ncbi:MAG: copper amine oxidase N-terminal domain-containing protein [Syntrophothermus sp.]|uniref:copper amine oxidase N-terminal domain-containing protein n=1 Tax=Syntrophothermus sp. TaxID=2736299 RepID=UPI00257C9483|nr:copper amine oxidase N-terminal domain-containing protein [Syntrophothermus sp.]NSW83090.1 copper amine oxidase N-terminal domain-containing protein [Syntrophothermus sp.]
MRKARNSKLALLLVLTMLATLFVAIPTASAATTYSAATTATFDPSTSGAATQNLGYAQISIDPLLASTSEALIEVRDSGGNKLEITAVNDYQNLTDGWSGGNISLARVNEYTYKITISPGAGNAGLEFKYALQLQVNAKGCASGDVTLKISKLSGQLSSGEVVVGKATGATVTAETLSVDTITESGGSVTIRLTENVGDGLEQGDRSVKLVLPNGFTWDNESCEVITGNIECDVQHDGNNARYLYLIVDDLSETHSRSIIDITADIVVDETKANYGDVNVSISGDSSVTPSSLTVARYSETGVEVTVENKTTVVAGKVKQEIGDIVISENAPESLVNGKTITITLPANAKWAELPDVDEERVGVDQANVRIIGTDGRTIRYTVNDTSDGETKGGVLRFKNATVNLAVNASGELKVDISGTAGADKKGLVVADIKAPLASGNISKPEVKIGIQNQAAGDIVLVENQAGALAANKDLIILLPSGCEFSEAPTVSVIKGDLEIDERNVDADEGVLTIPITGESTTASEIQISGIKYDVDRTVEEGNVKVKVQGDAVNEVNDMDKIEDEFTDADADVGDFGIDLNNDADADYTFDASGADAGMFPAIETALEVVNAICITPAPGQTKGSAVFTLGQASYTLNGSTVSMPVAPYAKNGRTYLPLRFCGNAIGIDDANIYWDSATKKATLKKDSTIVQVVLGSQALYVNGVQVATMDVAPEAKDGYTMLPIRPVLEAFGAKVTYDAATQAISIEY